MIGVKVDIHRHALFINAFLGTSHPEDLLVVISRGEANRIGNATLESVEKGMRVQPVILHEIIDMTIMGDKSAYTLIQLANTLTILSTKLAKMPCLLSQREGKENLA